MILDLAEAVDLSARAVTASAGRWADLSPLEASSKAVRAAAPIIAAQVAEQIAAAIEEERAGVLLDSDGSDSRADWLAAGLLRAIRVAREAVR